MGEQKQTAGVGWAWENAGRAGLAPDHPDYRMRTDDGARGYFESQYFPCSHTMHHGQETMQWQSHKFPAY